LSGKDSLLSAVLSSSRGYTGNTEVTGGAKHVFSLPEIYDAGILVRTPCGGHEGVNILGILPRALIPPVAGLELGQNGRV